MTPWYKKSLSDLERDASGSDSRALLLLAQAHLRGLRGATVDKPRALALLEQAAGRGSSIAARWIGDQFNERDDATKAITWWRRAAELGDTGAMTNLLDGSDSPEELRWMVLAAEAGEPHAKETLKNRLAGKPAMRASLAKLARTPLEEIASEADGGVEGLDVDLTVTGAATVNDLVGRVIERIFALWPNAVASARRSGGPFDFPAPNPPSEEDEEIHLHVSSGIYDVLCDVDFSEKKRTWDLTWMSVAPHPPAKEIEQLESIIRAEGGALGAR